MYDVLIIGAGVTGAAVARELSRYEGRFCVLEKEEDVCSGTSKANSGIVHAGYDAAEGSAKAFWNVKGNERIRLLASELDFPFQQTGSLVICTEEEQLPKLHQLYERGKSNGVPDLKILTREEVLQMEPNVSEHTVAALYAPTAGIVCPFGMTIALAENAAQNGVEFYFETEVLRIQKKEFGFEVITTKGTFETKKIVNASGVYADVFHNMVSAHPLHIQARRGEYVLLDKSAGHHVSRTIFALPGKFGKGVLVTPTVHGNLLVGPTATDTDEKEGTYTTGEGIRIVMEKSKEVVEALPLQEIITSFAGLRAHELGGDFIIGEIEDAKGFFDCAGIESPGLTAAPAIGLHVAEQLRQQLELQEKEKFLSTRKDVVHLQTLSKEEQISLIRKNPAYANIICRCEMVSEGEILDAIHRPLGAKSLDGVKRRTRAGMGRCQSGFCAPKTMEILAREWNIPFSSVTKMGTGSELVCEQNKKEWER